jgi:hypothetical protein
MAATPHEMNHETSSLPPSAKRRHRWILKLTLGLVIGLGIQAPGRAADVAFFGLATGAGAAKAAEAFSPMLPKGLDELRFGDNRTITLEKRTDAQTKKWVDRGTLRNEEVEEKDRKAGTLYFYHVIYGFDEGKGEGGRGLDSMHLSGIYDDKAKEFPQVRDLLSACFLGFGKPTTVIVADSYGGDHTSAIFLYWMAGKCPVWLRISRSISSDRMNFFLVMDLKPSPPEQGKVFKPTAAEFKGIYETWLKQTAGE